MELPSELPEGQPTAATPPPKPPGRVKVFACPNCGGAITLRAVGQSVTAQCGQCSSLIDVASEEYKIIVAGQDLAAEADIPLGKRGTLDGIEWEVVGFQERSDAELSFFWTEYLLFNPYYGYRFLINEDGHWTLAQMRHLDVPGLGVATIVTADGRAYRRYSTGMAYTRRVGGEFYWRASTDDVATTADYVDPPYRLFGERTGEEIIVSQGVYVPAAEIGRAFDTPVDGPDSSNVGANQPNPYAARRKAVGRTAWIAAAVLSVLQFGAAFMAANETVNLTSFSFISTDKGRDHASRSFELAKTGNIQIDTTAQLDNDWLELGLSLVNEKTGETFDAKQGMEFYSGYDSDGRWTEGDNTSTTTFRRVPAGTYKLLIEPDAGAFAKAAAASAAPRPAFPSPFLFDRAPSRPEPPKPEEKPVTGQIQVRRDVMNWSNYLIGLILIGAFPLYLAARSALFEMKRWSDSGDGSSKDEEDDE